MVDVRVQTDPGVIALYMEPSQPPYVVRHPEGGAIQFEVPWREGTATRTARHVDLLSMLVPVVRIPRMEVLRADFTAYREQNPLTGTSYRLDLNCEFYVVPTTEGHVAFPRHLASVLLTSGDHRLEFAMEKVLLRPAYYEGTGQGSPICSAPTLVWNGETLLVQGPGLVSLLARTSGAQLPFPALDPIETTVSLGAVHAIAPVELAVRLLPRQQLENGRITWVAAGGPTAARGSGDALKW